MKNAIKNLLIVLITSLCVSSAYSQEKKGHIYKVSINVDENMMERALVKNKDGSIWYDKKGQVELMDELDFENFSSDEVHHILENLSGVFVDETMTEKVTFEFGKVSANNMLGSLGANIVNKNQLMYFPDKKLKKVKVKADEYYAVKMSFVYGGGSTNFKGKYGELRLKTKIKIVASDKSGNVLWEKKKEIKELEDVFGENSKGFTKNGKYFIVNRSPRIFNEFDNEPINTYNSLSLEEIEASVNYTIRKALSE